MTISPKNVSDMDQASTALVGILPSLWFGLYRECVEKGFTEPQAMELVKVFISKTNGGGV